MSGVTRKVTVTVPATSANLGPGFDSLGLALTLRDTLTVSMTDRPGVRVEIEGEGEAEVPTDERNLVAKTILQVMERYGQRPNGLLLEARNQIPHSRGLGSSAAAIVSGIYAAKGLLSDHVTVSDRDVYQIATEAEGHPDNVAPAIFGGLTIAWMEGTAPHAKVLRVNPAFKPLILVPDYAVSTAEARALQPDSFPRQDTVFNLSRSALLVASLTGDLGDLMAATEDRLHQPYRRPAMVLTANLIDDLRGHGIPAVVSGAGPTVLVFATGEHEQIAAMDCLKRHTTTRWAPRIVDVDQKGATVVVH